MIAAAASEPEASEQGSRPNLYVYLKNSLIIHEENTKEMNV
jgi:hypothetical protein